MLRLRVAVVRVLRYNADVKWVAIVAVALGCSRSGPAQTLDAYGRALHRRDFDASYGLMSSAFRARVSRENYARMMRNNSREVDETAKRLRSGGGKLEVTAEFDYGIGDQMHLVQEGGEWRILTNPLEFYDQTTPKAALRSFLRAYRLARWDVMLQFVPNAYRAKMDGEKVKAQFSGASKAPTELLIQTLEAYADEPIVERGNDARMTYADKYEVRFLREDGVWKIEDLD